MSSPNADKQAFPFKTMFEKQDLLERLDLVIAWGNYEIRVLRFHLTSFEPGKVIGFHKHAEFEFHFIPRGSGAVILEEYPFALSAGMFYLTGPGVMHYQEASPAEAMDELCLHVDILHKSNPDADPWEVAEAEACMQRIQGLPQRPAFDVYGAMNCFLEAYQECENKQPGFYTLIKQQVIRILLNTVRAYDSGEISEAPVRDMSESRYQYAVQYMEANHSSSLTLESVAEKLNISPRQLQRIFRSVGEGRSFIKLLEDIRLRAVCDRLEDSIMSIDKIAEAAGFSNATYLHQVFRKRLGMTPAEYRSSKRT